MTRNRLLFTTILFGLVSTVAACTAAPPAPDVTGIPEVTEMTGAGQVAAQAEGPAPSTSPPATEPPRTVTAQQPVPPASTTSTAPTEARPVTTHRFNGTSDCAATIRQGPGAWFVAPADGTDMGPGPVRVEFVGCSDTYEANVVYEAYHGSNREPTLSGFTMGGTLGDWAEFRFQETFWTPGSWRVVILEVDAESGEPRIYDQVTFTIRGG